MRRVIAIAVLMFGLAAPAWAGLDEGVAAYNRGDYVTALRELRPLAEQGDPEGQFKLGRMHNFGQGVTQDDAEAVKWYRKAADKGHAPAQNNLGVMYEKGRGVSQDSAEAIRWYRKAAVQGLTVSQANLGVMCRTGRGVPRDYAEAIRWYRKAAEQNLATTKYKVRATVLKKAQAMAQTDLGHMYLWGLGVSKNYAEAIRWYREAAQQGIALAQTGLGYMYYNGLGVSQNHAEAIRWYREAAQQGNATAQTSLGHMYYNGLGVSKNHAEAIRWYREAAQQGNAMAQTSLGYMYFHGLGTSQDSVRALMWTNLALSRPDITEEHNKGATKNRDVFAARMTGAQAAEAKRLARAWRPSQPTQVSRGAPESEPPASDPRPADGVVRSNTRTAPQNRDGVAVIIGNKTYKGRTPAVDFAHNDADAMKRFVIDRLGYRPGNIIDLRDASKGEIEDVFGSIETHEGKLFDWIRPGKSDVVVFYSGHGIPGLDDKRGYLLPVDGNPNRARISGYPVDLLYKNLAKIPAKSVTVYLDACFSGDSPKGMIVRATSGISVTPRKPTASSRLTVLTAATGDQFASWDEKAKHGLFTKHLLEALSGVADGKDYGNGDGKVTVAEVKRYLDNEMTYLARRRFGRKQTATVQGNRKVVLATYGPSVDRSPTATSRIDHAAVETTLGLRRQDRVLIQGGLGALKLDAGPADGLFGPKTRAAIRDWQRAKGFAATGYLTKEQSETLVAQGK